jgi:pyrrolysine biosynthesis protein PylC
MVVAIAGGGLQGLEVTYLAQKAGYETLLLDKTKDAPAAGICDEIWVIELTDHESLTRALAGAPRAVDLVIPATENARALQSLFEWCDANRMPLAFDPGAFSVSSSKSTSNALFLRLGIPTPTPWPDCAFPVLAKPDRASGSKDVEVFHDLQALKARFGVLPPPDRVLQHYLCGPAYSLEVVGSPGDYKPLQITELEMDQNHDCKRVLAPSSLSSDLTRQFEEIGVVLADALGLSGIMDVEAIIHEGQLKVLEIDARFPSQTPMAVYHSTGINMVERLALLALGQPEVEQEPVVPQPTAGVVLEHILVGQGHLSVCGEGIMAVNGPLHLVEDFFGADEALTNQSPGKEEWVATLMVRGSDQKEALRRREGVIRELQARFDLDGYTDDSPPDRHGQAP